MKHEIAPICGECGKRKGNFAQGASLRSADTLGVRLAIADASHPLCAYDRRAQKGALTVSNRASVSEVVYRRCAVPNRTLLAIGAAASLGLLAASTSLGAAQFNRWNNNDVYMNGPIFGAHQAGSDHLAAMKAYA
jgi:hypothetical protein